LKITRLRNYKEAKLRTKANLIRKYLKCKDCDNLHDDEDCIDCIKLQLKVRDKMREVNEVSTSLSELYKLQNKKKERVK